MASRPAAEVLGLRTSGLSGLAWAALACALASLWLLGRRYAGLLHDAPIYTVQALRWLDPPAFANDLFFAFGSQDAYTQFPRLYAPLVQALGTGGAALSVVIAGQAAFLAAAAALVWRLVPEAQRWWSLALLAALSGFYGGVGTFRIAEPFATARSLAEPLVVVALACVVAGRVRMALLPLLLCLAIHPLVAATGFAALVLWHVAPRPRLLLALVAGAAALVVLGASLAGARLDPEWRTVLEARSPHLFLAQWRLPDWSRFAWGLGVLWLAWRHVLHAGRLVLAVAAAAGFGVALSGVAVDLLGSATLAGLQLWRAHWLVQLLAIALLPACVAALWQRDAGGRLAAACLAASCCFGREEQAAAGALVLAAVVLRHIEVLKPRWERAGLVLALAAGAAGLLLEVQSRLPLQYALQPAGNWRDWLHAGASVGGLLPLALLLGLLACSRFQRAALAVSLAVLALALLAWDARRPWPRFLDEAAAAPPAFRAALPQGAVVFWPDPHSPAWVVLRRAAWYGADQGAGIIFNRDTAVTYARRQRLVIPLAEADRECRLQASPACQVPVELAASVCGAPEGPSHLVLGTRIKDTPARAWERPGEPGGPVPERFFLSACADVGKQKSRR